MAGASTPAFEALSRRPAAPGALVELMYQPRTVRFRGIARPSRMRDVGRMGPELGRSRRDEGLGVVGNRSRSGEIARSGVVGELQIGNNPCEKTSRKSGWREQVRDVRLRLTERLGRFEHQLNRRAVPAKRPPYTGP